jgi:hypothetical protein
VYFHRQELWTAARDMVSHPADTPVSSANRAAGDKPAWDELLRPPPAPLTQAEADSSRLGSSEVRRQMLKNWRIGGASVAALRRVLRLCRDRGFDVLLIGVPVTSAQREMYTPGIRLEYETFLGGITREYGCRFVDYCARVPDGLFVDSHHVRPAGGYYFSRLLTYEQLVPWYETHRPADRDQRVAREP